MDAREIAADARNRIIGHEDVCAERWRNNHAAILDIKDSIRSQTRQMWVANGAVIAALGSLVWFLAQRAFPS